jgi:serine/threonine protein kinase
MPEVFPRKFGKYVLLKSLARGGMGEIYVAATGEPGFQKFCVIKKVIAERSDRGKASRFLDEAKVVLRLAHANLVPTFDAGECDGEFYIAMELVEGKDLREIWNRCVRTRTRIPLDVALHVGREIARALAYVHSYGDLRLVHRDVAPPNILVSYFGEVKLTDFGLARSVLKQEHTAPGVVFGRAAYLAPEQARGEIADGRSDIYSLGVVIWELLTGHQYLHLSNLDPATAMSLVRHPKPQPPSAKASWITSELDAVIMRALAPVRDDRYQTAEEMRQALADVIARLSPRADAERTAEFLRGLCADANREERSERERLLGASLAALAAESAPSRAVSPGATGDAAGDHGGVGNHVGPDEPTRLWRRPDDEEAAAGSPVIDRAPESPSGSNFTGRVIEGRYRILHVLGEGGMGTVYAGEHVEIGKGVAVKILHPAFSRQKDLVERFRREARAASRIGHPNIIDVTDFGTTEDGCAYFVMEHLDGIDLADVLSHERRLDPGRACQITIQICRALEAAHAAGVIHRDLKPENIFLVAREGQTDFVKVLDFGIARSLDQDSRRLTNPGIAMGTPEYMAPEQALGGAADRRSDIYSVGALLYEMVTGTPPHGEAKDMVPLRKQEPPRPPRELRSEISEELERIILRALELDPAKRHQKMAHLEYDLTKALWGRPRAVADLLGLRDAEVRAEDSARVLRDRGGEARAASPAQGVETAASAFATGAPPSPAGFPVGAGGGFAAAAPTGSPTGLTLGLPDMASVDFRRSGGGTRALRFWGTMTLLGMASLIAVAAYRLLPWSGFGRAAPAAPMAAAPISTSEARAARVQGLVAELERMLAKSPTFAQVPIVEDRLARLRRDGAIAAAAALAAQAARALERVAEHELDAGDIDTGISHYKIALAVDPGAQGQSQLAATLRARAEAALRDDRAGEAIRWARTALSLAEADPDAHALLAAALHASHDDAGAAIEFGKALASRPDDPTFKRGLERAQRRAGRPRHRSPAPVAAAPQESDGAGEEGAAVDTPPSRSADKPKNEADKPSAPPSAPAESATEQ